MEISSLGFIGGGRITRIFLQAMTSRNVKFKSVVVYDTNAEVLDALKNQFPFVSSGDLQLAASQPAVFIALHHPVIMDMLGKIEDTVAADTLVISLAPKITIEKIASKVKTRNIVRMIPNATSYINKGFNPLAFHHDMQESDRKMILKLMKSLGKTFETDESKLESYAIVSAMLPTYFWFQWKALIDVAIQTGLTEEEAVKAVKSTLKKAIKLFFKSGLSSSEVMDLIPFKPIGEHEALIAEIYQTRLIGLFGMIKP